MSVAQRSVNVLRRYADVKGKDQIAAGVFKVTADEIERMMLCIATLERELAESKAREGRLCAHIQEAADRAHIRSLTNTHYGKWLASLRDWHLAALQQKGDTNG